MNRIAEELDAKLRTLDDIRAERLARMVRDAMTAIELPAKIDANLGVENGWPVGYFSNTAGMFVDERFERPEQGVPKSVKSGNAPTAGGRLDRKQNLNRYGVSQRHFH